MAVVVVEAPGPIVDIDLVRAHLRLTEADADQDSLILSYIAAAQSSIDGPLGWLGQSLGTQKLEVRDSTFSAICRLPYGPVQQIDSIVYVDPQGVEQTVAEADYQLSDDHVLLAPGASWPQLRGDAQGVRVTYTAGYEAVPPAIVQAILLLVGMWWRNRMAVNVGNIVNDMPHGVVALLSPYRRF